MTDLAETPAWRPLAAALAASLAEAGALTDARWRAAFEHTPRHLFVPRFYRDNHIMIDGVDAATADEWLRTAYSDDSLVTQRIEAPGDTADVVRPTSSSTMPSLMARMLELLEVTDSSRVLEIGTATGYNAALLCHRLGADQVASIELHPGLAAQAADHLARLGYQPALAVGDGALGFPAGAPYDRILATCAVPAIPPAWIEQLAPGGRIVADLRGDAASSLAVLDKSAPDTVQGRLLAQPGLFMWLRAHPDNPLREGGCLDYVIHYDDDLRPTDLDLGLLAEPGLRVLIGILDPTFTALRQTDGTWTLRAPDGSWAEITTDGATGTVRQGGPRSLWPAVTCAADAWQRLGRPERGRYGVTARSDGTHRYWVDQPDRPIFDDNSSHPAGLLTAAGLQTS